MKRRYILVFIFVILVALCKLNATDYPTTAWDETTPAGDSAKSLGDDRIREMKIQIREVLTVDHDFATSGSSDTYGKHKAVHLMEQSSVTNVTDQVIIFSSDTNSTAELWVMDGAGNEVQLSTGGYIGSSDTGIIKGKLFQRIYSNVLTSSATSISITGLTGDTDKIYQIFVSIKVGDATDNIYIQFNGDTGNNYSDQSLISGGTTVTASRNVSTSDIDIGNTITGDIFNNIIIYAKSGYIRQLISRGIGASGSPTLTNNVGIWTNTADELTSIQIACGSANGLGIGTTIEVYTRR